MTAGADGANPAGEGWKVMPDNQFLPVGSAILAVINTLLIRCVLTHNLDELAAPLTLGAVCCRLWRHAVGHALSHFTASSVGRLASPAEFLPGASPWVGPRLI
jgi:hypothetical protein